MEETIWKLKGYKEYSLTNGIKNDKSYALRDRGVLSKEDIKSIKEGSYPDLLAECSGTGVVTKSDSMTCVKVTAGSEWYFAILFEHKDPWNRWHRYLFKIPRNGENEKAAVDVLIEYVEKFLSDASRTWIKQGMDEIFWTKQERSE